MRGKRIVSSAEYFVVVIAAKLLGLIFFNPLWRLWARGAKERD